MSFSYCFRYVGCYLFFQPTLMIRDPELIKQITVKDFDVFPERQQFIPEGIDPLWDKNLFSMKGKKLNITALNV